MGLNLSGVIILEEEKRNLLNIEFMGRVLFGLVVKLQECTRSVLVVGVAKYGMLSSVFGTLVLGWCLVWCQRVV